MKQDIQQVIGVVTLPLPIVLANYGSLFQHYALRKVLRTLGWRAERYQLVGRTFAQIRLRRWYYRTMLLRDYLMGRRAAVRHWRAMLFTERTFSAFYRKHIGPLHRGCYRASVFVVGSDQVWSTLADDVSLRHVPRGARRIAYAASADWRNNAGSDAWREEMTSVFRAFDHVSVRERYGQEFLQRLVSEKAVFHAIDPVFLLGRVGFERLLPDVALFERPTLFVYLLNLSVASAMPLAELEKLAAELGCDLKMAGIQGAETMIPEGNALWLSPTDFLRAVRDATYVVTNSFHGTALSILFQKSFLSLKQSGEKGTQNVRQRELLERLGLTERYLGVDTLCHKGCYLLRNVPNWNPVAEELARWRQASQSWLEEALPHADSGPLSNAPWVRSR